LWDDALHDHKNNWLDPRVSNFLDFKTTIEHQLTKQGRVRIAGTRPPHANLDDADQLRQRRPVTIQPWLQ